MANQFLGLGLFIMLLSFFIVLNSMSSFESEKAESVIKSINKSFWAQAPAEKESFSQTISATGESFRSGDALDEVKSLFQSTIPGSKTKKNRLGTQLTVQVPRPEFESALKGITPVPEELSGFSSRQSDTFTQRFPAMLAGILDTKVSISYTMDILFNMEEDPSIAQKQAPEQTRLAVKKSASYAALLEKEGLDPKLITSGLSKGPAQTITLVFKRYQPIKLEVR